MATNTTTHTCSGDQCDTCELEAMRGTHVLEGWVWYPRPFDGTPAYWRYVVNLGTQDAFAVWAWWNGDAAEWKPMGPGQLSKPGGTAPRFTGVGGVFSIVSALQSEPRSILTEIGGRDVE